MGLDAVEFIMAVEESFGITIPSEHCPELYTPKNLIDYLHDRLPKGDETRCLSQRAFYAIRQELVKYLGIQKQTLRPNSELLKILPEKDPQGVWAEVGKSLHYPKWKRLRGRSFFAWLFWDERPRTLGDAARRIAVRAPHAIKAEAEGWSCGEIASVVAGVLWYELGIKKFDWDDQFVRDLGID